MSRLINEKIFKILNSSNDIEYQVIGDSLISINRIKK